MNLTALIPAYNDDYALRFCLASIVDRFDQIIVLDDASTDHTPDVAADFARRHKNVRYVRHEGRQLGWIEARNRLATLTDADHLFWLDSDDVLCEYNADLLERVAQSPSAVTRLPLCEMWGDFHHTTQRLRHYDRCHVYVNRRAFSDFFWTGGTCARPEGEGRERAIVSKNGPGPLLFHIKGVKPDRRLVERQRMRDYLRAPDRPDGLRVYAGKKHASPIGEMTEEEIHALALRMLLHSRQDRLTPTYRGSPDPNAPRRPEVIEAALPGRFEIVYKAGQPVDRIDRKAGPRQVGTQAPAREAARTASPRGPARNSR